MMVFISDLKKPLSFNRLPIDGKITHILIFAINTSSITKKMSGTTYELLIDILFSGKSQLKRYVSDESLLNMKCYRIIEILIVI